MHFMHVRQMRPHRLKRFFRMPRFDLHLALHRLDCLGSHGMLDTYAFCQDKLSELTQEDLRPRPLLTGRDLIAMGFTPGPLFGKILKRLEDAQLNRDIVTKEEACRFIMTVKFT
jgi:poly(A) polymerase